MRWLGSALRTWKEPVTDQILRRQRTRPVGRDGTRLERCTEDGVLKWTPFGYGVNPFVVLESRILLVEFFLIQDCNPKGQFVFDEHPLNIEFRPMRVITSDLKGNFPVICKKRNDSLIVDNTSRTSQAKESRIRPAVDNHTTGVVGIHGDDRRKVIPGQVSRSKSPHPGTANRISIILLLNTRDHVGAVRIGKVAANSYDFRACRVNEQFLQVRGTGIFQEFLRDNADGGSDISQGSV